MNDNIFSSLLGFVLSLILFFFLKKVMKLDRGPSSVITFILIVPILFFYTKDIKMLIGFSDSEIRVTDGFKPVKVYNKLKISNFTFKQIYIEKEITNYGYGIKNEKEKYVIEYSVNIVNKGEPIVTIDDPSGNLPIGFNEDLVLKKMDGIDGKENFINFGVEDGGSELFTINGEKIEYSTKNPINTNDEFICVGKILLDKEEFNELTTREYESYLYIRFGGTTKEKYSEPNGYGFIIKQDNYRVDLSDFISNNSKDLKYVIKKNVLKPSNNY